MATIIPRVYTYYISTALFAIFGVKMLKEGYYMSPNEAQDEFEEVQSDEVLIAFVEQSMQNADVCVTVEV